MLVNRVVPLMREGGSSGVGLQFVSHGFAKHPLVAGVGYAVLVGIGSAHFVWGWARWLGWGLESLVWDGEGKRWRWWEVNALSALVAGVWMAGGLGIVGRGGQTEGWIGRGFDELYRAVPVVGRWM